MMKRIGRIIVTIFLVSLILRFCFVLININHNCSGEDCEVCMIIHQFKSDLEGFNPSILMSLSTIIFYPPTVLYLSKKIFNKKITLINLKVQLNN